MSIFIVAKVNLFDNEISQYIVEASSLEEVYFNECKNDNIWSDELISIEDIKQEYFNTDMLINIIQLLG